MTFDSSVHNRLKNRLWEIHGQQGVEVLPRLLELLRQYPNLRVPVREAHWNQRDIVLITYGDHVRETDHTPLESLRRFLAEHQLPELINTVHILPFCPSTSDDGFSVVDHKQVDSNLGSWRDIERFGAQGQLMFDLVVNHVSRSSPWFQGYLAGDERYLDYFIEVDPAADLSMVTRPRSSPLLTEYQTSRGPRHVWTTFSADQIDLNYANPTVLLEVLDTLLFYIQQGARIVRLDAVAYLWKEIGTNCIHRPQTHGIVKLMRDIVQLVAPQVLLLTETNVPHAENISYFGEGDEAHMVYQFSLPPLLAESLLQHDASTFNAWLNSLDTIPPETTYFNFTASHDGIGVRPLEGLVSDHRLEQLVEVTRARMGFVGTKRNADGNDTPYELNITYLDLLSLPGSDDPERYAVRFLASQALMLSLRGIPGIYINSLLGTRNDGQAVELSGIARRINRHKFTREELDAVLADSQSLPAHVFREYRRLLSVRIRQPAFHPEGPQRVIPVEKDSLIAFLRTAPDESQRILVLGNVAERDAQIDVASWDDLVPRKDLLAGTTLQQDRINLKPYQVAWIEIAGKQC